MTPEVGAVPESDWVCANRFQPSRSPKTAPRSHPAITPQRMSTSVAMLAAASFLEHGAATRNGGDRYQIVINADADVLADNG